MIIEINILNIIKYFLNNKKMEKYMQQTQTILIIKIKIFEEFLFITHLYY
jgi:hypothetical protein